MLLFLMLLLMKLPLLCAHLMTFSVTVLDLIFVLNSMKCGSLKGYFRFFKVGLYKVNNR